MPIKKSVLPPVATRRTTRRGSASRSSSAAVGDESKKESSNEPVVSISLPREGTVTRRSGPRDAIETADAKSTDSPSLDSAVAATLGDNGDPTGKCVNTKRPVGGCSAHRSKSFTKKKEIKSAAAGVDVAAKVAETKSDTTGLDASTPGQGVPQRGTRHQTRNKNNKRKAKNQVEELVVETIADEPKYPSQGLYIVKRGIQIKVKIIIENGPYSPSGDSTSTVASAKVLGNDGNQYYCQVCGEFGDVVCCDGCPKVFHPDCVPMGTTSRQVLDTNQEPWYCPLCSGEEDTIIVQTAVSNATKALSKVKKAQEVQNGPVDVKHKTVSNDIAKPEEGTTAVDGGEEQQDNHRDVPREKVATNGSNKAKRSHDEPTSEEKARKKKKKKRRQSNASISNDRVATPGRAADTKDDAPEEEELQRAVPSQSAFLFYIAENRWKVEKALTKGHRTFNRLPKGNERNAIVVQEAFQWWNDLSDEEKRPHVALAVKDFEQKLLLWKEQKEAAEYQASLEAPAVQQPEEPDTKRSADTRLAVKQHDRLYNKTSVGCRVFKPESDQSHNRVLLDLLYDARFHPLPLFDSSRNPADLLQDREASVTKSSTPFFDVHGPVSTSLGDECLGCTRGWNHTCPILKERIPFVEYRARLQAPVSAMTASRVGLGLRNPQMQHTRTTEKALFQWRESSDVRLMEGVQHDQSYTLSKPSDRYDEIVRFVEEAAIMKVPEPSHEETIESINNDDEQAQVLIDAPKYRKCGRCRTIVTNTTGCVQCRRASLVIDKSKHPLMSGNEEEDTQKVQTAMLSRIQCKEDNVKLRKFDPRVSEAILQMKWSPSCILPDRPPMSARSVELDDATTLSASDTESDNADAMTSPDEQCIKVVNEAPKMQTSNQCDLLEYSEEKSCKSSEPNDDVDAPKLKRTRSTRIQSHASKKESIQPFKHDEFVEKHKREAKEVNRTAVQTSCYCIFLALVRRDPLHLFARPVETAEYLNIIKNPIDFRLIRQNLLDGKYSTVGSFCSDCRLLCENALAFNSPSSVYYKTALEMHELLAVMQKRASNWIGAIKDAHEGFILRLGTKRRHLDLPQDTEMSVGDPFEELRTKWPQAVQLLDRSTSFRHKVESDFIRTRENELAYYGTLAVQRAAMAAESSLAPYPESRGAFSVVPLRNHFDDEALRRMIDDRVGEIMQPELGSISTWREESLVRLVRRVQTARLDRKTVSDNGCSRCDLVDKANLQPTFAQPVKSKKKFTENTRSHPTRKMLATGLASEKVMKSVDNRLNESHGEAVPSVISTNVAVRGSKTHGMGLYAEQTFKAGDIVAEYVGEYVVSHVADEREKLYRKQRIQDYQFRLDDHLVIDATKKGGPARYINHSCTPNCKAKIIDGSETKELRRVLIVAQGDININDEISYDYQFPLELDLAARVPCNCGSESCRGFMNWDLPEKGSNCRALLAQKRGANMRDRIRRLGRPLKRDE